MRNALSTFSHVPVFGCLRDARGTILGVTQRLLDAERKRARDVVGRKLIEVWPHGAAWLKLDRVALRSRKPIARLEYSVESGRWLQSTRIPRPGRVIMWVAEDRTAEVQLKALRAILGRIQTPRKSPMTSPPALPIGALLAGSDAQGLAVAAGIPIDMVIGSLTRLAR